MAREKVITVLGESLGPPLPQKTPEQTPTLKDDFARLEAAVDFLFARVGIPEWKPRFVRDDSGKWGWK